MAPVRFGFQPQGKYQNVAVTIPQLKAESIVLDYETAFHAAAGLVAWMDKFNEWREISAFIVVEGQVVGAIDLRMADGDDGIQAY